MSDNAQTPSPPTEQQDPTYDPRTHISVQSLAHTNISNGSRVSDNEKSLLTQRAPAGQRCLVTLDVEPLYCCHVITRSTKSDMLKNLECAWGIKQGEFRLQDLSNLLWLRQDMHARFDNQDWALVPTLEVLQAIALFDFNRRGKPASSHYTKRFPDKIWDYHFVPLRPSPIVFCRFNDDREFYKVHNYPFETLRLLQSHVHPFFAIYNAAKKIIYHKDKKNNYPDSDSQLPSGFDQHFELCISIFDSWGKPATETQEPRTITQPPPSNSSHPPGTSRSQPSQGSQQSQDRAERARRRNNKSDVQDPPQSGPGAAPQGRKRMVATSTGDQYLPTPEQPLYITNGCDHQLAAMDSETSSGTRHWTSVSDWIEGVKVSGPCEDPYEGYTENEKQSLIQYSSEEARCPPWGPWEEWIPEYKIV